MFRTLLSGSGHHAWLSRHVRRRCPATGPPADASARGPGSGHFLTTRPASWPLPRGLSSVPDPCSDGGRIPGVLRMFSSAGCSATGSPSVEGLRLPWESLRGRRSCWRRCVPLSCGWFTGLRDLSISVIPRSNVYGSFCRISGGLFGTPYCTVLPDLDGLPPTVSSTIAVFHSTHHVSLPFLLISTRASLHNSKHAPRQTWDC